MPVRKKPTEAPAPLQDTKDILLHHILDALKTADAKIDDLREDLMEKIASVQKEVQAVREQAATFQCHVDEAEAKEVTAEKWRDGISVRVTEIERIINRREAAALAVIAVVTFIASSFGVYLMSRVFGQ